MRTVGIDITDQAIVVVELRRWFGSCVVRAVSRQPLPSGAVIDAQIRDQHAVSVALQECMRQASPRPMTTARASFSIAESLVFTHTFTFPRVLKPKEVEEGLAIQFSDYFPYDRDDMVVDWYVSQKTEQTQSVCVVACKKGFVEQILTVAKKCGIQVDRIESRSMSIARATLPQPKKNEAALLITIEASVASFAICDERGMHMTSLLDIQGNVFADTIIVEAKRLMQYAEVTLAKNIAVIYLCGSASVVDGVDTHYAQQMQRPVVKGDVLRRLRHHHLFGDGDGAWVYTNAVGLALGSVYPKRRVFYNFLQKSL